MESLFEITYKNALPLLNPKMNFAEKTINYAKIYINKLSSDDAQTELVKKLYYMYKLLEHLLKKKSSLGDIILKYNTFTNNIYKDDLYLAISEKSKELYNTYPLEDRTLLKDLAIFSTLLDFLYRDLNKIIQSINIIPSSPTTPDSAKTLYSPSDFFTIKRNKTK